jgi:putative Mg2+ transporter-C (MgtC) family protein
MMDLDIDVALIVYNFTQLFIALLLALPVALNREFNSNGAGLRTFPLVAVASCAFMLVGMSVFNTVEAEARVMYGIMTGMGFIGGGAIFKTDNQVSGTATAAGIWNTGAIGVSVAFQRYEIAIVLSVMAFVVFHFGNWLKSQENKSLD